jgi:hypothetical protein
MSKNDRQSDGRSEIQPGADDVPWPPGAIAAIAIASGFSAIVLLIYWGHFRRYPVSADPSAWGPFGDYIGGLLNPVVAFCALLLLAASLRLQARELSSALREFKAATKLMARQSFEANLWQMLKLHHEFARGITLTTAANAEIHGRSCFSAFSGRLKELAAIHRDEDQKIRAEKIWRYFVLDYEPYMTHYLRLLERILNLIESEANSEKVGEADRADIKTHIETVRATLSRDELIVLFFWGISSNNIKQVLDKYELLRHIEVGTFPRSDFAELYRHLGSTPPAIDAE